MSYWISRPWHCIWMVCWRRWTSFDSFLRWVLCLKWRSVCLPLWKLFFCLWKTGQGTFIYVILYQRYTNIIRCYLLFFLCLSVVCGSSYFQLLIDRLESKSLPQEQSEDIKYLCYLVCRHFLPFMKSVFSSVFTLTSLQDMMGRTPHGVSSAKFKDMFALDVTSLQKRLCEFVDLHQIITELEQRSSEPLNGTTNELDTRKSEEIADNSNSTRNNIIVTSNDNLTSETKIVTNAPLVINWRIIVLYFHLLEIIY